MHRIMADLSSKSITIDSRPSEENYNLKIPTANSANTGKTGFRGSFDRIFDQESMKIAISNAGPICNVEELAPTYNTTGYTSPFLTPVGSKFTIEPQQLLDMNGVAVVDALNPLGGDLPFTPGRARLVHKTTIFTATYPEIVHPKIALLKNAVEAGADYGWVAIAVWTEYVPGTSSYRGMCSRMAASRKDTADPNGTWSYIWQTPFELTSLPVFPTVNTYTEYCCPLFDVVEFDDGTIFLVVATARTASLPSGYVFRSVDFGSTWVQVSTIPYNSISNHGTEAAISLERINERLIVVQSMTMNAYHASNSCGFKTIVSDDFGVTWTLPITISSTAIASRYAFNDLAMGPDNVLHAIFNHTTAGPIEQIAFTSTLDGENWTSVVGFPGTSATSAAILFDRQGNRMAYFLPTDTGGRAVSEIQCLIEDPITKYFYPMYANHMVTWISGTGYNSTSKHIAALSIENGMFTSILATEAAGNYDFANSLMEIKVGMWSGFTTRDYALEESYYFGSFDQQWFPHKYPGNTTHPKNTTWTRSAAGTYTETLTRDTSMNRGYLRITTGSGNTNAAYYASDHPSADLISDTGCEARICIRVNSGHAVMAIKAFRASDGKRALPYLVFSATDNKIYFYDGVAATKVDTIIPTNWSITEWNTYHLIFKGDRLSLYRSSDQFTELLHFEYLSTYDGFTFGASAGDGFVSWGCQNVVALSQVEVSRVDFEFCFVNFSGTALLETEFPIDQDTDLLGRHCTNLMTGFYSGISGKFDGNYVAANDYWTLETGAMFGMENIFIPSPTVCWMSSSFETGTTPGSEPDEVMSWFYNNWDDALLNKIFQGFVVFGRNWPYCKLEYTKPDTSVVTLFDSSADPELAYMFRLEADAAAVGNRVIATMPTGIDSFTPNRFASTPEIKYYLMPTEGALAYQVFKILENDEDSFYLAGSVDTDLADGNEFIIFSDRFYFDLTTFSDHSLNLYTITRVGGILFTLTIYGTKGGANIVFPEEDDGLKRIGSIHLGKVYDLPNENWEVSVSTQPSMSVIESRGSMKEYRRLGAARRTISLGYTGVQEKGFGVNPVVDLNRTLGWGENPLIFIDDVSVLNYDGDYTHPLPILTRMVNGYQMQRVVYNRESEHQGDESLDLTRTVVDISGISLEEVI